MVTKLDTVHAAVLALNNISVALLQKGCYNGAKHVFTDALIIVQNHNNDLLDQDDQASTASVSHKVVTAAQMLASYTSCDGVTHSSKHRCVDQDDLGEEIRRMLDCHGSEVHRTDVLLVKLETSVTPSDPESSYCPAVESAVILYNCAVALLAPEDNPDFEDVAKAHKFMRLSAYLVSSSSKPTNIDEHQMLSHFIIPFSVLLHRQLLASYRLLGIYEGSEEYEYYARAATVLERKFHLYNSVVRHLPLSCAGSA